MRSVFVTRRSRTIRRLRRQHEIQVLPKSWRRLNAGIEKARLHLESAPFENTVCAAIPGERPENLLTESARRGHSTRSRAGGTNPSSAFSGEITEPTAKRSLLCQPRGEQLDLFDHQPWIVIIDHV